jgi:hypothetical protein
MDWMTIKVNAQELIRMSGGIIPIITTLGLWFFGGILSFWIWARLAQWMGWKIPLVIVIFCILLMFF